MTKIYNKNVEPVRQVVLLADNLNGGAARLAENFLANWISDKFTSQYNLHVFYSDNLDIPKHSNIFEHIIPNSRLFLFKYFQRARFLSRISGRKIILNFTNFPLLDVLFSSKDQQITLVHNAYLVSNPKCYSHVPFLSRISHLVKLLFFFVTFFLSRRSVYLVQTVWMQTKLKDFTKIFFGKRNVFVADFSAHFFSKIANKEDNPHASGNDKSSEFLESLIPKDALYWFYPAAFYPHKNHFFLLELGKIIKDNHKNNLQKMRIVVTLDSRSSHVKDFLKQVNILNLKDIIINVGWVPELCTQQIFKDAQGLLFLSTFESLGLPLLEAMVLQKRIVAADIASTKEIVGDNAFYFDIFSPEAPRIVCNEIMDISKIVKHNTRVKASLCQAYFYNYIASTSD